MSTKQDTLHIILRIAQLKDTDSRDSHSALIRICELVNDELAQPDESPTCKDCLQVAGEVVNRATIKQSLKVADDGYVPLNDDEAESLWDSSDLAFEVVRASHRAGYDLRKSQELNKGQPQ
jgi:hypothetical protein